MSSIAVVLFKAQGMLRQESLRGSGVCSSFDLLNPWLILNETTKMAAERGQWAIIYVTLTRK